MNKKILGHALIAGAVVGVAVGTLFTVRKVREMYSKTSDKVGTPDVAYSKPEIQVRKEPGRKPVKVKLVDDEDVT